MKFQIQLGYA